MSPGSGRVTVKGGSCARDEVRKANSSAQGPSRNIVFLVSSSTLGLGWLLWSVASDVWEWSSERVHRKRERCCGMKTTSRPHHSIKPTRTEEGEGRGCLSSARRLARPSQRGGAAIPRALASRQGDAEYSLKAVCGRW